MAIRGLASRLDGKSFQVLTTAANNTPADGAGFNLTGREAVAFSVEVPVAGSQGSINVTFQHADTDVNASYAAVPDASLEVPKGETTLPSSGVIALTFAAVMKRYGYKGNKKFIRTISSGAAGTPNFSLRTGASAIRIRHIGG